MAFVDEWSLGIWSFERGSKVSKGKILRCVSNWGENRDNDEHLKYIVLLLNSSKLSDIIGP